jgi:hypothetical protein
VVTTDQLTLEPRAGVVATWYNARLLLKLRHVVSVRKLQVGTFEEIRYALHDFAQILVLDQTL